MIQPDARSRFTTDDLSLVLEAATGNRPATEDLPILLLDVDVDDVLDRPTTARRIRTAQLPGPSASLFFYVLVRQAMLRRGLEDRMLADYCAALLREFGVKDRSRRIAPVDDQVHTYLVDILNDAAASDGERRFRVLAHLGNYALWLSGFYPDRITGRSSRRGGPGLSYYEALGGQGYAEASGHPLADRVGLSEVFRSAAESFGALRETLNDVSTTINLRAA